MEITLLSTARGIQNGALSDKTVIVIDTMRGATCMVAALAHGCDRIIPALSANEAAEMKRSSGLEALLCGEISSMKIPGFDLGNSPSEYCDDIEMREKVLIFATTNGSVAIRKCEDSACTLIGSFANATAVAKEALLTGNDIVLVCAGHRGKLSLDDIVCAGYFIKVMLDMINGLEVDDFCRIAYKLYMDSGENMFETIKAGKLAAGLLALGLQEDVEYCLQKDIYDIVPVYKESVITKK